jgi:hypothetical protein
MTTTQLEPSDLAGELARADVPTESATSGLPGRRLLVHVLIYGTMLLALLPFMRVNTAWSVDEGLYVYQVRALQDGHWNLDYWASSIDPDGRWFPLNRHEKFGDSYYPYVKAPVYPALVLGATRLFGDAVGLHLLPIVGALLGAVAAWLLASLADRRAAPYAFWIAALGPVVVNAYAVWAHALSTGIAGLTAYVAIRALRDRATVLRVSCVTLGVAGSVLLRTEGLLFAAALAAVFLIVGAIRLIGRSPGVVAAVLLAGVIGVCAVGANRLEHRWVTSFAGDASDKTDYMSGSDVSYLTGKIQGATHILANTNYYEDHGDPITDVKALLTVTATCLAGVALTRRSRRATTVGIAALGVVIGLLVFRFLGPPDTAPGIIAAWPTAIVGLLLFKWRAARLAERVLLGVVVLEVLGTLATQYPQGGAIEWGARYLSPLYPLIACLAALSLYRTAKEKRGDEGWRIVRPALVLLTVLAAGAGLYGMTGYRASMDRRFIDPIEGASGPVITSNEWYAQVAYRTFPDHQWLHVPEEDMPAALTKLADSGYKDVIVYESHPRLTDNPTEIPGGYEVRRVFGGFLYLSRS